MRVLSVCLFAVLMLPGQAMAGWCEYQTPPTNMRQEPTVTYEIFDFPPDLINEMCGFQWAPIGLAGGCVENVDDNEWQIYIRNDLGAREYNCILQHEKAHLPPNNWVHGPNWARSLEGDYRVAPGPRWRRPVHVDPFYFARGRVGSVEVASH